MKISILTVVLDSNLLNLIKKIKKNNISVSSIIVAVKKELHPLRKKQIKIRQHILTNQNNSFKHTFLKIIPAKIKSFLKYLIFLVIKFKYKFRIIYLDKNFENNESINFNDITLMYSYEGIINQKILKKFKKGLINIHPAIIPEYRGLDAGLWALYEGGKLGVSAYKLDEGIDTGPIIKCYSIKKRKFKNINEYIKFLKDLKLNSYVDAVVRYKSNKFENYNPKISKHQNRGLMSLEKIKELVKRCND